MHPRCEPLLIGDTPRQLRKLGALVAGERGAQIGFMLGASQDAQRLRLGTAATDLAVQRQRLDDQVVGGVEATGRARRDWPG